MTKASAARLDGDAEARVLLPREAGQGLVSCPGNPEGGSGPWGPKELLAPKA